MNLTLDVDKLFDRLERISPAVVSVGVVSGLVLFLPDHILQHLQLEELPGIWRTVVAVVFLFCVFAILSVVLRGVCLRVQSAIVSRRAAQKRLKLYSTLDERQKQIIREILTSKNMHVLLPIDDGNVEYLIACGFIFRPAQQLESEFNSTTLKAHFLAHPWLVTEYHKNPSLFVK